MLYNNKEHISYSEVKEWHDCPFRHKLKYIDGIDLFKSIPAIDFGTAVHSMCEHFLKTKEMDFEKYENKINELWEKYKDNPLYSESEKQKCNEHAKLIMNEIPNFMQENFACSLHFCFSLSEYNIKNKKKYYICKKTIWQKKKDWEDVL
jgi:ATP-dependent helicase/DNAse subunit B